MPCIHGLPRRSAWTLNFDERDDAESHGHARGVISTNLFIKYMGDERRVRAWIAAVNFDRARKLGTNLPRTCTVSIVPAEHIFTNSHIQDQATVFSDKSLNSYNEGEHPATPQAPHPPPPPPPPPPPLLTSRQTETFAYAMQTSRGRLLQSDLRTHKIY